MGDYRTMLDNLTDLWRLHELIWQGTDREHVLKSLGWSRRTFFRALQFLRTLGAPVRFDRAQGTYRYAQPWDFWSAMALKIVAPSRTKRQNSAR